mmetsp:Transcript_16549/g.28362  ORF Transcript_16549/g.28362 Transcript_16549/m.28362 type:complete len:362 (+) Transcript_16549:51-1136(+)
MCDPTPIFELLDGFRMSRVMFELVELGLVDLVCHKPCTASECASHLASIAQMDPESSLNGVGRLLHAGVALGLLNEDPVSCRFSASEVTQQYLATGSVDSLAGYVVHSSKVVWPLFTGLGAAVSTGKNVWHQQLGFSGNEVFSNMYASPAAALRFMRGMHSFSRLSAPAVADAFDLSQFRTMVDLGGATGALAFALAQRWPQAHVCVVDLPHVTELAQQHFTQAPHVNNPQLLERVSWAAGDFMQQPDQLPSGDLVVLGRILHDWSQPQCQDLLRSVHNLLPPGGGLLIAEMLLDDDECGPVGTTLQSLNMLCQTHGQERTVAQYTSLLHQAGFTSVQAKRTGKYLDALLATKPCIQAPTG